MDKYRSTLVTVLLLLAESVCYSTCDTIDIIPTPESPCPGRIIGVPCLTLQQYIANPSKSSNVMLVLYPGDHKMDSKLSITTNSYFMMTTATNSPVSITCGNVQQFIPPDYACFSFVRLQQVSISGITFVNCTMNLESVVNASFVQSSFVNMTAQSVTDSISIIVYNNVSSLLIIQCTFINNTGTVGINAINTPAMGTVTIIQSIFTNNHPRTTTVLSTVGGGSVVMILNSIFSGNGGPSVPYTNYNSVVMVGGLGVIINNTNFTNNIAGGSSGAIYASGQVNTITNCFFENNVMNGTDNSRAGALTIDSGRAATISNCSFKDNVVQASGDAREPSGAALSSYAQTIMIVDCYFSNNRILGAITGNGGAVRVEFGPPLSFTLIKNSIFIGNAHMNGNGGAIAISGGNITVVNSIFINNTAVGGGGSIYSSDSYTNISLTNNTFYNNTANYCGVLFVDKFDHIINITGNTFMYNRAVGQIAGSNEGGVACIRNASVVAFNSTFSYNSATGDAGVLRAEESNVALKSCQFSKNSAKGDGGVLHTFVYPTSYFITQTSFTSNQAGGNGGAAYTGVANSQIFIDQSTLAFNQASARGGAIAVAGSTLKVTQASIYSNSAKLGSVVSACKSSVYITNPKVQPRKDPVYPFCTLYDGFNKTTSSEVHA